MTVVLLFRRTDNFKNVNFVQHSEKLDTQLKKTRTLGVEKNYLLKSQKTNLSMITNNLKHFVQSPNILFLKCDWLEILSHRA